MRRPHRIHWRLKAVIQQLSVIAALPQRIEALRSCLGWMAVASIGGAIVWHHWHRCGPPQG